MIQLKAHGYIAEILPQRGANLVRLAYPTLGIEALRTPTDIADFSTQNPFLFGVPILFFPNRISDASFEFEGRTYRFDMNEPKLGNHLHGHIHDRPMQVVFADDQTAQFCYQATKDNPYMDFPHAFTLTVTYALEKDGLHQTVRFYNQSQQNMPVALGFHTTFRIPFVEDGLTKNVRLHLSVGREIGRNEHNFLPNGEMLSDYPLRQLYLQDGVIPCAQFLSKHYEMVRPGRMCLWDTETNASILYEADPQYAYWMVYNGGNTHFLCVEPQTWMNNCPNAPFDRDQTGFAFIQPGQQREYHTLMRLEHMETPS